MPCTLLHVVEQVDPNPYADPDLKDLVGRLPEFFCRNCDPFRQLTASQAARCLDRGAPCWMQPDQICG